MKKINIILALIASTLIISCSTDDSTNDVVVAKATALEGTISTVRTVAGTDDDVYVSITLPQTFNYDAEATVQGIVGGVTKVIGSVDILAGSTTGTAVLTTPSGAAVLFGYDMMEVSLDGVALFEMVDDGTGTLVRTPAPDAYTVSSNVIDMHLYNDIPAANATDLEIILDWRTGASDLDFYLVGPSGLVDYGWFDWPEPVTLPSTEADGDYFVAVDPYTVNTATVDFKIMVRQPEGEITVYSYDDVAPADIGEYLTITKSGSTYTVVE